MIPINGFVNMFNSIEFNEHWHFIRTMYVIFISNDWISSSSRVFLMQMDIDRSSDLSISSHTLLLSTLTIVLFSEMELISSFSFLHPSTTIKWIEANVRLLNWSTERKNWEEWCHNHNYSWVPLCFVRWWKRRKFVLCSMEKKTEENNIDFHLMIIFVF